MKIKISNKLNTIPIALYVLWVLFVLCFFFFQLYSFSIENNHGEGYVMIGLQILTIVFSFFSLLLIAIINLFSKKKYYTDYEFISIPFFVLIGIMILTMLT